MNAIGAATAVASRLPVATKTPSGSRTTALVVQASTFWRLTKTKVSASEAASSPATCRYGK